MRIVGGMWRGRSFEAPEGRGTRPTTDRMRESLASAILSALELELDGCSVLDAFAGSGGVGLELLSRGAAHCTFCERDRRAAALVRRNCSSLGAAASTWTVMCCDVLRLSERTSVDGAPFGVVFMDPPYATPAAEVCGFVESLARAGLLASDCLAVYERSSAGDALDVAGFEPLRTKRHGSTCIDMLRRKEVS